MADKKKKKKPKTIADAWDHYYDMTGLASASTRQLAFAGIAVIWVLAAENKILTIDHADLRIPLLMLVFVLLLDLWQYVLGSSEYWTFARDLEKAKKTEFQEFPRSLNKPSECVFIVKVAAVITGYLLLIIVLLPAIFG